MNNKIRCSDPECPSRMGEEIPYFSVDLYVE